MTAKYTFDIYMNYHVNKYIIICDILCTVTSEKYRIVEYNDWFSVTFIKFVRCLFLI